MTFRSPQPFPQPTLNANKLEKLKKWDGALGTTEAYTKVPAPSGVSFLTKEGKNKKEEKMIRLEPRLYLQGKLPVEAKK